ncbi:MAG: hypothetical protein COX43_00415 [Parcubacteria group bacterium CG23_combo_of_CG06-09_8_20_14_all_35_9]|nr:MAG: hypothetical protein COX43_00415 [Parcubacteria group bacterium CG23_combo_of_CG06-09_8_20_14_all_35_9]
MKKTDREIIEDILKITSKVNNDLQSFKQDVDFKFDKIDKRFDGFEKKNTAEHKRLERMILRGDETIIKLLVKNEERIDDPTGHHPLGWKSIIYNSSLWQIKRLQLMI